MSTIKVDTIETRTGTGSVSLSNHLELTTGGLTINTVGQALGVGTNNPSHAIQVHHTAPEILLEETTTGGSKRISMGVASDGLPFISAEQTSGQIQVNLTGAEVARFNSNGLAFPSGKGIDFSSASATTSGNTGNSNPAETSTGTLLDDYEEGYFTPTSNSVLVGSGSITAVGMYVKVGNLVNVTVRFNPSNATTNANQFDIFLPFKAASTQVSGSYNTWTGTTRFSDSPAYNPHHTFVSLAGDGNTVGIRNQQNTGVISQVRGVDVGASFNMDFTITYRTV